MDGVSLSFDDDALDFIVQKAIEFKLGARGLRSICEGIMNDLMSDLPVQKAESKLVITKAYAEERFDKLKLARLKVA